VSVACVILVKRACAASLCPGITYSYVFFFYRQPECSLSFVQTGECGA